MFYRWRLLKFRVYYSWMIWNHSIDWKVKQTMWSIDLCHFPFLAYQTYVCILLYQRNRFIHNLCWDRWRGSVNSWVPCLVRTMSMIPQMPLKSSTSTIPPIAGNLLLPLAICWLCLWSCSFLCSNEDRRKRLSQRGSLAAFHASCTRKRRSHWHWPTLLWPWRIEAVPRKPRISSVPAR